MNLFITIRFLDILDILLVAFILYQLFMLIKGTVAFNIFLGFFFVYLFWLLVKALNMELMGSIMGQFIGVGVLALIIVFQQEIRKFLLMIGTNYQVSKTFGLEKIFSSDRDKVDSAKVIKEVVKACENMARSKTGALIVIPHKSELIDIIRSGERINARISEALIETVFFKNSPLHDGAMVISGEKLVAARCILPVTDRRDLPGKLGLRHRAAIGITESTDALAIVVSEETGRISVAHNGILERNLSSIALAKELEKIYTFSNQING